MYSTPAIRRRCFRVMFGEALLMAGMFLIPTEVRGMWMMEGDNVPVERLTKNIERHIQENPKDARAYYVLARVHSLAYAQGGAEVFVIQKDSNKLPKFPGYASVQVHVSDAPLTDALFEHLRLSIENYRKAVDLAPKEGLYRLGLGWMLDQASQRAGEPSTAPSTAPVTAPRAENVEIEATTGPASQPASDKLAREALSQYAKAVELSLQQDLKRNMRMEGTDQAVSLEASRNALVLMDRTGIKDPELHERLDSAYKKTSALPTAITPIIFPLDVARPLAELIDSTTRVRFDLAGDGIARAWPWVRDRTGILVWDPSGEGQIESGRQLFGSATWWMFWNNGYDALAALDDDGDGALTGSELDGIAVWHDRNGDACPSKREVTPASKFGIASIAVRFTRSAEGEPFNSNGIVLHNGQTLPSYDWTPTSCDTLLID